MTMTMTFLGAEAVLEKASSNKSPKFAHCASRRQYLSKPAKPGVKGALGSIATSPAAAASLISGTPRSSEKLEEARSRGEFDLGHHDEAEEPRLIIST